MRAGEKGILIAAGVLVLSVMGYRAYHIAVDEPDPGIPFYTTAAPELKREAELIYKRNKCSDCHSLWMRRNMVESVPAPALDGIGSLRNERWFYEYLSAPSPQVILPTRLKLEYRMPSYAHLPENERRMLAAYLASLKVEDWYFEEVKKSEYEKLTGEKYQSEGHETGVQN